MIAFLVRLISLVVTAESASIPRFLGQFAGTSLRNNTGATLHSAQYETRYFRQRLDHFSFAELPDFNQRYLVGTANGLWNPPAPIFFYCGNEGDIEWFSDNTGFVWEIAPSFAALVVFAEHRYYGQSMPFGSKEEAYKDAKALSYLTTEQALADFAALITDLKRNMSAEDSPVVLFGGSYGGMLAAWMRLKYPHIAIGALASSAPILQFEDISAPESFYDIVSSDFKRESLNCFDVIKSSWDVLEAQGKYGDGLASLSGKFRLCKNLNTTGELSDWLDSAYSYLAMVDYPYASNFLMPLPAYPIKEVCKKIDGFPDDTDILDRIFAGVSIYYNYTGSVDCFDLEDDPHGMSGWDWQACTEMVMPTSSSNEKSMFPPYKFDYPAFADGCIQSYGVRPRPTWVTTEFGGHIAFWKKANLIFLFFLLRKLILPFYSFTLFCIILPMTMFVPEAELPAWVVCYIPATMSLLNILPSPRSFPFIVPYLLFENTMSVTKFNAMISGLFQLGSAHEWVVTKKSGRSSEGDLLSLFEKEPKHQRGGSTPELDSITKEIATLPKKEPKKKHNRIYRKELTLAFLLLTAAARSLLSAQGIHFYFLLFQGISFLLVGLDLIGEQIE